MNSEIEIEKLLRARRRMERKIKELDKKVEHLLFLQKENRQCLIRNCPFDDEDEQGNV